jgi:ATP/maltotriose-dependent transcriptional regulator MalT
VADQHQFDSNGDHFLTLTKREVEVLGLVLEGRSSREMATTLFCSKRTIDFHLARIYEKLRVSNRVQAVRRATLLGIVSMEPACLPK